MNFEITLVPTFETDSANYEVLTNAVIRSSSAQGATVEIGMRRGGGTRYIVDALITTGQNKEKPHIAIDPYGNIEYYHDEINRVSRSDYTNMMRNDALFNMYLYCMQKDINFYFFNMEDTEFFSRFADGVPIYNENKYINDKYSMVHFDGPHTVDALDAEISFFHDRTDIGATFVFDDVGMYEHDIVDKYLVMAGYQVFEQTDRKWAYFKKEAGIPWMKMQKKIQLFSYNA